MTLPLHCSALPRKRSSVCRSQLVAPARSLHGQQQQTGRSGERPHLHRTLVRAEPHRGWPRPVSHPCRARNTAPLHEEEILSSVQAQGHHSANLRVTGWSPSKWPLAGPQAVPAVSHRPHGAVSTEVPPDPEQLRPPQAWTAHAHPHPPLVSSMGEAEAAQAILNDTCRAPQQVHTPQKRSRVPNAQHSLTPQPPLRTMTSHTAE